LSRTCEPCHTRPEADQREIGVLEPFVRASATKPSFIDGRYDDKSNDWMISVLSLAAALSNWAIMVPFVILLVAIALAPLIAQRHWERHYHKLCVALAGIVCLYHLFIVHRSARVVHAGIDYVTFMVIVGSFFVIAGGIHLRVKSPSGAMRNTLFLFVGALLGNLIGTIDASMLLIRPWIAMNKGRVAPMHIAFFIFWSATSAARCCPWARR
jgi:Na+/H+ antiporter NhaD/arsenite permease-like protein